MPGSDGAFRATLIGGPFDGERRPILSLRDLEQAPAQVFVCRCPCCDVTTALVTDDPRVVALMHAGARMHVYEYVGLQADLTFAYEDTGESHTGLVARQEAVLA